VRIFEDTNVIDYQISFTGTLAKKYTIIKNQRNEGVVEFSMTVLLLSFTLNAPVKRILILNQSMFS